MTRKKENQKIIKPAIEKIGKQPFLVRIIVILVISTVALTAFFYIAEWHLSANENLNAYMYSVIAGISGAFAYRLFEEL